MEDDKQAHDSEQPKYAENQYQGYAIDLYILTSQKKDIQRQIGQKINRKEALQVVSGHLSPVGNFHALVSVGGARVQKDIYQKEKTDKVDDLRTGREGLVLKGDLKRNQGAACEDQYQNKEIPDDPGSFVFT